MVRPTQIFIGHRVYDVRWMDEQAWKHQGHTEEDVGVFGPSEGVIYLLTERHGKPITEDYLREVLLHEVLHGVAFQAATSGAWAVVSKAKHDYEEIEEWLVNAWSPPLIQLLIDNHELLEYLVGDRS